MRRDRDRVTDTYLIFDSGRGNRWDKVNEGCRYRPDGRLKRNARVLRAREGNRALVAHLCFSRKRRSDRCFEPVRRILKRIFLPDDRVAVIRVEMRPLLVEH